MSGRHDIAHPPAALALKVATRALVVAAGGGDGAGATLGIRQQKVSDCGNPHTVDFMRIDQVAALEDVTAGATGHPHVSRALAQRQGFALVRLPEIAAAGADLLALVARHAGEFGEVATTIVGALADGKCSGRDAADALPEVDQAIEVLVAIRAELALIKNEGGR